MIRSALVFSLLFLPFTAHAGYQIITSPTTFTVPAGVTQLSVFVIGGGGGAGGGNNGWGSASGGGCGGAINGSVLSVTPGQQIPVAIGAGGAGGGVAANGSTGGTTSFGSISAAGGAWGRSGYYNFTGSQGGSGGGSGGGGGGNGWPGYYALSTPGGTSGSTDPRVQPTYHSGTSWGYDPDNGYYETSYAYVAGPESPGGCIGGGWSVNPATFITQVSWSAGQGGPTPVVYNYYGGGGGGGVVINGSTVNGASGGGACSGWGCPGDGGAGYGGGGGGTPLDYHEIGGSGAPGAAYVEWVDPAPACSISLSPSSIAYGGASVLSWSASNATSIHISNVGYVSASGATSVSPSNTTTYTCSVSGAGGSASQSATLTVSAPSSCSLPWGGSIAHGQSATAYQESSVAYGSSCVSQTRSCSNGSLSGSYAYQSCAVQSPSSCSLPWGGSTGHGTSVTAYQASAVPYGSSCASQTRSCSNGSLSGSYSNQSCAMQSPSSCNLPWGGSIAHGQSATAYQESSVAYGSSCVSQARSCSNGSLSGSYTNQSCSVGSPANCSLPWGGTTVHGTSVTAYQASTVPYGSSCASQTRSCSNGSLSGSYSYSTCSVNPPPTPTCSVNVSPTSINRGNSATLTWSSTNVNTWFYINNVGYVSSSGSTSVSPNSTTSYTGQGYGYGQTISCSGEQTLTVSQPCSLPWGGTTANGSSVTAYQTSTVPYGGSCSSQTRSCSNGSLSGSYTFESCAVAGPASCTLGATTISHGDTVTAYSSQIAPTGQVCSAIAQSRTCTNGSLSGSASYQYMSCSCAPQYYCAGNTVMYQNNACATSTVAACGAPSACVAGQSACVYPDMAYADIAGTSGELTARPEVVPTDGFSRLYWNVSNAQSCTVIGDNGDSWTGATSGTTGQRTSNITRLVWYTLSCTGYPGTSPATLESTINVNILPIFEEI